MLLEEACSDGAKIEAIWFRARMLSLMPGMLKPWTRHGELDDVVFKVVAAFPMYGIKSSVAPEGPPFDVQELFRELQRAARE